MLDCGLLLNELARVIILPGLTTTEQDLIPAFVEDLRNSDVRRIALFPTALGRADRWDLYRRLEEIRGLTAPHVHLRTDCDREEIEFLTDRFQAQAFNIHPIASRHPFGEIPEDLSDRFFVENVEVAVAPEDLDRAGGLCPDYSHLESARLRRDLEYVNVTEEQLATQRIGCCHVSAIRPGVPNDWNGGADHHHMASVCDLDYMARYANRLPSRWLSLELENSLAEQLDAAVHLREVLAKASA